MKYGISILCICGTDIDAVLHHLNKGTFPLFNDLLFKFQVLPHFLSVELTMFICGFFKYFLDSNTRVRTMIIWSFPHCTIMGKLLCLDGPTSKKCE